MVPLSWGRLSFDKWPRRMHSPSPFEEQVKYVCVCACRKFEQTLNLEPGLIIIAYIYVQRHGNCFPSLANEAVGFNRTGVWTHIPVRAHKTTPLGEYKMQLGETYILSLLLYMVIDSSDDTCIYFCFHIYIYLYIYMHSHWSCSICIFRLIRVHVSES